MKVSFTGGRLAAGVPISEVSTHAGIARSEGRWVVINNDKSSTVGLSAVFEHFTLDVPCNCALQPGDTIEISSVTILLVEVGSVKYNLCGGQCVGSLSTDIKGFGIGLGRSTITWVYK